MLTCPIKKTLCKEVECYIETAGCYNFSIIFCKKADKDSMYILNMDGEIVKLRTDTSKS